MSRSDRKDYWRSLEERNDPEAFLREAGPEFASSPEGGAGGISRRRFLAVSGFTFMGGLSQAPMKKALSYLKTPDGAVPGRILEYASTCQACPASCGLLVRSKDGRPIKLEGNPEHALSRGGLCAAGQASLLGLYDRQLLRRPLSGGAETTWENADAGVRARLDRIRTEGGAVRILSRTLASPTLRRQVAEFLAAFRDARHVSYDPLSASAILDAHQRTHGVRRLPHYRIERADVLVSFDADFLGTWISPVEFTRAYASARKAGGAGRYSWHAQVESRLSVTGAKADLRVIASPAESRRMLSQLAGLLAPRAGLRWEGEGEAPAQVREMADRLWGARGSALVLSGSPDLEEQMLCNLLNHVLGAYGGTLDLLRPSLQLQGSDVELETLRSELREGRVSALILLDANPVYELRGGEEWRRLVSGVPLSVACAERLDETAAAAGYVCPHPHPLAAWADAEPVEGMFSLAQPLFPVLGEARPVLESLAVWAGKPAQARALLQEHWRTRIFPRQSSTPVFQAFWDRAVHDGFVDVGTEAPAPGPFDASRVRPLTVASDPADGGMELILYPKVSMQDGRHAYTPWLQELPDPITKTAWDNYASVSPALAERQGLSDGDVVALRTEHAALELPVLVQPGQHPGVLAVALGYGSVLSERFRGLGPQWIEGRPTVGEDGRVGKNALALLSPAGVARGASIRVRMERTGRTHPLARSQTHHAIEVPAGLAPEGASRRPLVQEVSLAAAAAGHGGHAAHPNLWPEDHAGSASRWGMVIDLNACTGCSACVLSCQAENNIPVVGKDEVRRQRDLQWLRIDRYYADNPEAGGGVDVAFQPMLCHHCGNAPCETVCPVLATVQSSEGLNQQVYNRCVGTRYCANNCPYKVRRFNWFEYPREDALQNLALNPDVTVRSRGVMEKCSFCVQRIQEAKMEARRLGKPVTEAMLQTACQQSCPAQAITFGDLKDLKSAVSERAREGRTYQILDELNVRPAVHYQRIVRNRPAAGGSHE